MTYQEETMVSDFDLREAKFDKSSTALYSGCFTPHKLIRVSESVASIDIPSSVRCICNYALKNTRLNSLCLPSSISFIGHHAFHGSSLKSLNINEGVVYIGSDAFKECRFLAEINLPESLLEIGERAFRKCLSVKHFIIPPNVQNIGGGAFAGCKYSLIESNNEDFKIYHKCLFQVSSRKLISCWSTEECVTVVDGTKIIATDAFDGMWYLKEVYLPKSITLIEHRAFNRGINTIWVPLGELDRFQAMLAHSKSAKCIKEYLSV